MVIILSCKETLDLRPLATYIQIHVSLPMSTLGMILPLHDLMFFHRHQILSMLYFLLHFQLYSQNISSYLISRHTEAVISHIEESERKTWPIRCNYCVIGFILFSFLLGYTVKAQTCWSKLNFLTLKIYRKSNNQSYCLDTINIDLGAWSHFRFISDLFAQRP